MGAAVMKNAVELERRFLEIPKTGFPTEYLFEYAKNQNHLLRWADLLSKRCSVVLGEAGSGKTTEFRQRARRCREEGRSAFFVPLEALASDGFPDALAPEDAAAFEKWRMGDSVAFFFLDSLDEAKLARHKLAHGLRKFGHGVGLAAIHRARVVISCRGSDWDIYTDNTAILEALPNPSPNNEGAGETKVDAPQMFAMAPLDSAQVRSLAAQVAGIPDPDDFVQAITRAHAGAFVERPADVLWLATFWKTHGNLGTLREIIYSNAREKLRETTRPPETRILSEKRAWEGALWLAGAATLSGTNSLIAGDTAADEPGLHAAIDPAAILPDWTPPEIAALLRLPLFDESTYGRVRIHERSVQEYLAAAWLRSLLEKGLPRQQLELLLFPASSVASMAVLRPHLRSTAAWLALNDVPTRRRLRDVAPEVLLAEGDPSGIPVDERRGILLQYVEARRGRRRLFDSISQASLGRFAYDGLGHTVNELVCDRSLPEEVRCALLTIAAEGHIQDCTTAALQIARDNEEQATVRAAAIAAVASTGNQQALRSDLLALTPDSGADSSVVGAILMALYPSSLSDQEVGQLILRSRPKPRNLYNGLQYTLEYELPRRCPAERRLPLVRVLLDILRNSDRQDLIWLQRCMLALLRAAIESIPDGSLLPPELDDTYVYYENLKESGEHVYLSKEEDAATLLHGRPKMRRELFWKRVGQAERARGCRIARYHDLVCWNWLIELGKEDHEWLAADCLHGADADSQVLAFDCLLRTAIAKADEDSRNGLIRRLVTENQLLDQHLRKLEPAPDLAADPEYQRHLKEMRSIEKKRNKQLEENRRVLESAIQEVRAGRHTGALHHLYYVGGPGSLRRELDASKIEKVYGKKIAEAFFEGLRAFWRQVTVPRPHDWKEPNKVPIAAVLGLAGLSLQVAEGLEPKNLDSDLRKLALRLALWEPNQPPPWFADLVVAEPEEARALLIPLVRQEFELDDSELRVLRIDQIGRLVPKNARDVVIPDVVSSLLAGDPKRLDVLEGALQLLEGAASGDIEKIEALAPSRCHALRMAPKRLAVWLVFWLNYDGKAAMDFLSAVLAKQEGAQASETVEELLSKIWAWGDTRVAFPTLRIHQDAETLARLVPIAFTHVPRSTDLEHESTYSPSRRDHAQDVRDRLVSWLSELPPDQSIRHLRSLADDPRLFELRDYLLYRVKERFTAGKSCEPWPPEEVARWGRTFTHLPGNPSELFAAVWWALQDIKVQLEDGDHSNKALFCPKDGPIKEKPVQIELIRELSGLSRGRYVAVAEEEIAESNYPDIRVHNPAIAGGITIEVKIAERWSYLELLESVREQIVGRYLRDTKSIYGILAIASSGPKRGWQHDDGTAIPSFADLLERLQVDVASMQSELAVKEMRVIGIDFH